jgi:hypothetical protein
MIFEIEVEEEQKICIVKAAHTLVDEIMPWTFPLVLIKQSFLLFKTCKHVFFPLQLIVLAEL